MENGVVGGNARNRSRESLIVDDAVDMAETDLQGAINRLTTQDNGVSAKNLIEGPGGLDSRIARLDTQIQSGSTPALIAQRDALVMGRAQLRFSNFRQNIGSQREPLGVTRPESPNVNIREADRYRDSRTFLTETKNGEVTVYRDSPEETRRFVYDLPVYQNLGLGTPPNGWQRIEGSLENTAFFRRPTGYRRMINGREARIRVDWDPTKGAHYNIELPGVDANGRAVTHKLAVGFRCGGRPCTEAEVFDMANELVP
jgi:PHD/YefM family antitoxin component YafN of YafNO toxin-antitoxin module